MVNLTSMCITQASVSKFFVALIPTGFFAYTLQEYQAIQLLFIVLAVDVVLGITLAIKFKRFSSHNMGRVIPKFIGYCLAVIVTTAIARTVPEASALFFYTISFFILTEISSHIENLSLLGVKFPDKLMMLVNKNYKNKDVAMKKWFIKNGNSY